MHGLCTSSKRPNGFLLEKLFSSKVKNLDKILELIFVDFDNEDEKFENIQKSVDGIAENLEKYNMENMKTLNYVKSMTKEVYKKSGDNNYKVKNVQSFNGKFQFLEPG
jgi:hypothetical protein